jgi:ribonuclease-3
VVTGRRGEVSPASDRPAVLASELGHVFADSGLLVDALTHPSLAGLNRTTAVAAGGGGRVPGQAYERLEFLGDRVLGLVVAEWLLERFPGEREGSLARRHAALVRREALAVVADGVDLGRHLLLSPGEQGCGGRANRTILADACEAVIGALYLDGGLAVARRFVRRAWEAQIDAAQVPPQDCKTALQEWAQGQGKPLPAYEIVGRSGPAHEPEFQVAVRVEGYPPVHGTGRSRRLAETAAARSLLRQLGHAVE